MTEGQARPIPSRRCVVMVTTALYNARAEQGPAHQDSQFDATTRRFTDGRGVFRAGGVPQMKGQALRQTAVPRLACA